MKKYAWLILALMVIALLLTGCSSNVATFSPEEKLADIEFSGDAEAILSQMHHSGDHWDALFEDFDINRFYIHTGTNPEELEEIYSVKGCYIYYIASNENYIAWCEEDEIASVYEYKLYDRNKKQATTILRIEDCPYYYYSYSEETIGFFNGILYLVAYNEATKTVDLMRYDPIAAALQSVYTFPVVSIEMPFHAVSIEGNVLSAVLYGEKATPQLLGLDITAPENVIQATLPEEFDEVYDLSYDKENKLFAITYLDEDVNENISLYHVETQEITSLIRFSDSSTVGGAFQCKNGHLYFVSLKSPFSLGLLFGNSNYALVDYDYINNTICEAKDISVFSFDGNTLYAIESKGSIDENFALWKIF